MPVISGITFSVLTVNKVYRSALPEQSAEIYAATPVVLIRFELFKVKKDFADENPTHPVTFLHAVIYIASTIRLVVPDIEPNVAVITDVLVTKLTPVARPAVLIVATASVADVQVTSDVISLVVLSEYVPVAVNCCVPALVIDGLAGVIAIDESVAEPPHDANTPKTNIKKTEPGLLKLICWPPFFNIYYYTSSQLKE
jgi:hypothetical protein